MVANIEREKKIDKDFARRCLRLLSPPPPDWTKWAFLLLDDDGNWSIQRVDGRFFSEVQEALQGYRQCHVFRSDGLLYRSYERVYTYPRLLEVFIEEIPYEALMDLAHDLNRPLRQYRNESGGLPSFRKP